MYIAALIINFLPQEKLFYQLFTTAVRPMAFILKSIWQTVQKTAASRLSAAFLKQEVIDSGRIYQ